MKKDYKTLALPDKYAPKASEKYMSDEQKAYFYRLLMSQRKELENQSQEEEVDANMGKQIDAAGAMDEADLASISVATDIAIEISERNKLAMQKIDAALERLENGKYGYSLVSGEPIGLKRLRVRPTATMTIEEKEENE